MTLPAPSRIVTLLTDFGVSDPFVGIMKGVLLRDAPELQLIDVTHAVPPQDVALAEFWLAESYRWFAPGTVHLCVVDPGVGSDRAALAAYADGHYFVAPDNGVLGAALQADAAAEVRRIDLGKLGIAPRSNTFHGRDVFAPVAALLASGKASLRELGEAWRAAVRERVPPKRAPDELVGRVVAVDHFGNLITDLPAKWLQGGFVRVEASGRTLEIVATYSEAEVGECVALVSSFETLEIAVRNGNAAVALGL
ncbi:MAG TPA: SAM-dependent chlorinase/fluorinase, partial [Polyangiaceae bacterium]|nr:SAM-dependent chlorinase/fluorinase [Polyangiaceae bacterium]